MRSQKTNFALIVLGVLLLAGGVILTVLYNGEKVLPYLGIGIGCGLFGHGMGEVLSHRARCADPERFRQMDIEKNDERSAAIGARAKAKSYDLMTYVFGALMISFAFMGVDTAPLLLLVFAYLFVHACTIYYRAKLEKEM